jgi:hypothetical protein
MIEGIVRPQACFQIDRRVDRIVPATYSCGRDQMIKQRSDPLLRLHEKEVPLNPRS